MKTTHEGFFLHKYHFNESSSIVIFYTQREGIQKWVYKGGRKKSALNPLGFYELVCYKRPESELGLLQSIAFINPHLATRSSPPKLLLAFFICDIVRQTIHEGSPDSSIFDYLKCLSKELNESENIYLIPVHFLSQWMSYLGITPIPLLNARALDPENGVFLIESNLSQHLINGAAIWNDYLNGIEIKNKQSAKEMLHIMMKYLNYHVPNFNANKITEIIHQIIYE